MAVPFAYLRVGPTSVMDVLSLTRQLDNKYRAVVFLAFYVSAQ